MCRQQGEVECTELGGGVSYEQAVRHLETYALSQFEIQNRPRQFVSRDQEGNVYYMQFAAATASSSSSATPDPQQGTAAADRDGEAHGRGPRGLGAPAS